MVNCTNTQLRSVWLHCCPIRRLVTIMCEIFIKTQALHLLIPLIKHTCGCFSKPHACQTDMKCRQRHKWNTLTEGKVGEKGPDRWSTLESEWPGFHLLNQSDVCSLQSISCLRFRAIRPACELAVPRHCSDKTFKHHWVEEDVHYLPGENLIDLSAAEWDLNHPSSYTVLSLKTDDYSFFLSFHGFFLLFPSSASTFVPLFSGFVVSPHLIVFSW